MSVNVVVRPSLRALASVSLIAIAAVPIQAATQEVLEEGFADDQEIIVTGEKEGYVAISSAGLKTDTPLIDTPQTVSVVTREQLDDQALQDIGDILRYTPGASIGQGEGNRDQITIRGQNTTADFFVDGIRDDVQYFRPLYNIERVEIHKGPNAMIFGRGGGGGIVNRVTKSPIADRQFGEATASVDSFGAYFLSGDLNLAVDDTAAFRINGLYEEFNNHRNFYDGRRFAVNPTFGAELDDQNRILLSYEYVDDDRAVDRGNPAELRATGNSCSFADPCGPLTGYRDTFFGQPGTNRTTLQAHIVKLRVEHDFSDELMFSATTQYGDYDKLYRNIYPVDARSNDIRLTPSGNSVTLDGYVDTTDRENFITQSNLLWTGDTGAFGHSLLLGYEIGQQQSANARRDILFAASNDDLVVVPLTDPIAVPAFTFPVFNRSTFSNLKFLSLYVQDQISIGDHFDIIGGVRFDRFDLDVNDIQSGLLLNRTDEKFSPRFGAIYKPQENISIYASYAKSFLPRSGDQFLTLTPNTANLAPETFVNYEIGVKWDLTSGLSLTTALFRLDRDDQAILLDNQGNSTLSGSRTEGVEFQLVGKLTESWQINAGYSYLNGQQRNATTIGGQDLRLFQVPEHMVSLWTKYDFTEQFAGGIGVTHQASQFATNDNSVRIPAFTRVDAALYYDLSEKVQVQLNVENLFDETYFPSVHNNDNISTGEPLNARLTVKFGF
ncbi:MAG: TonB-dependent siderophore receptor [Sphingomonadales bacterium]|nr:TonB-dependent siderophore receptor [Sphingomonadales bacterium]NCO49861.1 TonB-dependent siderophore receptor [Sphingomonadales bacterium]NCP01357.1 TonB-dependent siderophore receptor [Sphingomonadales bacterium]NCP25905.1 TonB-dependent siderophore receptor [Sphingomonadales bacterium]NCP43269.1 TonB-dependent siderophore receptor [Sphingomonadales bacterium]